MNLYFYIYAAHHRVYMQLIIFNSVHNPDVSISHSALSLAVVEAVGLKE
jgi:hypothetical protein